MSDQEPEEGWRFELSDLPPLDDEEAAEGQQERAADGQQEAGNVAGTISPETPLEPGSPSLENALFVVIGVVVTVVVLVAPLVISPGEEPGTLAAVVFGIVALGGMLYYLFHSHTQKR